MKTAPLADVKAHLSALVDEVVRTHEQVTITRNGEPEAEQAVSRGEYATRNELAEIMEARRRRDTSR